MMTGLALAGAACAARQDHRGALIEDEKVAAIQNGRHSRADVAALMGSPSSISTFPQRIETWFYISKDTSTWAFLAEEVIDQRVVAIDFDTDGRVQDVRHYGMKDGKKIDISDRVTPTKGREFGLLEQLFGNIGRFNDQNTGRQGR